MRNAGLDEAQAEIKIARRNINNGRDTDDTILMAESEEELISLLMKVKEESENVGLKLNIQKMKIMASGPITWWQIDGERVTDFIFGGSKTTSDGDCSHEIKRHLLLGRKVMTNLDSLLKSRDIANKGLSSQSYGFSSSHVSMWDLEYKESWAPKNWCFWTVVLEKTLGCPLDCKEIQPVHPKGNQSWIFIGGTDAEAEVPVLNYMHPGHWCKELTHGKDSDTGNDWRREGRGMKEDEMVGWHHWVNEHEFEQAPGAGDGQGCLACCSPWGPKESDTTEQLNCTELSWVFPTPTSVCLW